MARLSSSRLLALVWFVGFIAAAARLPDQELRALSVVANSLGKRGWINLDVNPCTNQPPWWNSSGDGDKNRTGIKCDCTSTMNTTCHVTNIVLKRMNLDGSLPQELVELPFLEEIDLSLNYLNGTIPRQWGSMQSLKIISVLGNRLTGEIPKDLANITTLEELVLEANQFTGNLPSELGNLTVTRRLVVSSNNLSGEIPATLAKLTTLTEFRISDNTFTGSIPGFIQNLTNLVRIDIQGTGLTGPIPSNLTSLTKLVDLRISDLNGSSRSDFPILNNSSTWQNLILRSCNIDGGFPEAIKGMSIDKDLDLSFNKLTGPIPLDFDLANYEANNVYLTGNSLNGSVPQQTRKNMGKSAVCSGTGKNLKED